jgi:hypothetical protein
MTCGLFHLNSTAPRLWSHIGLSYENTESMLTMHLCYHALMLNVLLFSVLGALAEMEILIVLQCSQYRFCIWATRSCRLLNQGSLSLLSNLAPAGHDRTNAISVPIAKVTITMQKGYQTSCHHYHNTT